MFPHTFCSWIKMDLGKGKQKKCHCLVPRVRQIRGKGEMSQPILQEHKSFQRCPPEGAALPYSMQQNTVLYASYTCQGDVVDYIFKSFIN